MANEECVKIFNGLLRGERSAVETYRSALEKVDEHPERTRLQTICNEHERSVSDLESHITGLGGTPDQDSGAWGTFANAVQNTAELFGDSSAVSALKQGEEHGRDDYQDALEKDCLLPECRTLVQRKLDETRQHIQSLDAVLQTV